MLSRCLLAAVCLASSEVANSQDSGAQLQINLRFDPSTAEYLHALVRTGLYGNTPTAVVRMLVNQGIREAIRDHHIEVRRS